MKYKPLLYMLPIVLIGPIFLFLYRGDREATELIHGLMTGEVIMACLGLFAVGLVQLL